MSTYCKTKDKNGKVLNWRVSPSGKKTRIKDQIAKKKSPTSCPVPRAKPKGASKKPRHTAEKPAYIRRSVGMLESPKRASPKEFRSPPQKSSNLDKDSINWLTSKRISSSPQEVRASGYSSPQSPKRISASRAPSMVIVSSPQRPRPGGFFSPQKPESPKRIVSPKPRTPPRQLTPKKSPPRQLTPKKSPPRQLTPKKSPPRQLTPKKSPPRPKPPEQPILRLSPAPHGILSLTPPKYDLMEDLYGPPPSRSVKKKSPAKTKMFKDLSAIEKAEIRKAVNNLLDVVERKNITKGAYIESEQQAVRKAIAHLFDFDGAGLCSTEPLFFYKGIPYLHESWRSREYEQGICETVQKEIEKRYPDLVNDYLMGNII